MKLLIFDLDGVIYAGDEVKPFAADTIKTLRNRGFSISFLTNNSTRSRKYYSEKLTSMGIPATPDDVMSSAVAACCRLEEKSPGGARVFIVGEEGLREELAQFTIVDAEDRETADYVVVGYDREFTYRKMADAFDALQAGAELIATNKDATFPVEGGRLLPGGGTIVAALEAAWGRKSFVCGKPNAFGIHRLMEHANATADETMLIGDRAETDILAGRNAGVTTCLVLTGITKFEELDSLPDNCRPHYVIENLGALPPLLDTPA